MLPCQHTFCLKCSREMTFKEIIGKGRFRYIVMEIKCALCRKWYDLTNRGPDGLANNLTLVQLLTLTGHDHQHYPSCFSMIPKNDIRQDPESISEMLKCGNCSKQMKKPKMLPCQHNFCKDCLLSKMKIKTFSEGKKYIKCKICDKYYQLPKNGPDGLPINRTLLDLQAINNQPIMTGSKQTANQKSDVKYESQYSEDSNDSSDDDCNSSH